MGYDANMQNFDANMQIFDANMQNFDATMQNFDANMQNFDATMNQSFGEKIKQQRYDAIPLSNAPAFGGYMFNDFSGASNLCNVGNVMVTGTNGLTGFGNVNVSNVSNLSNVGNITYRNIDKTPSPFSVSHPHPRPHPIHVVEDKKEEKSRSDRFPNTRDVIKDVLMGEEEDDSLACVYCFERRRKCLFGPCNHISYCITCVVSMWRKKEGEEKENSSFIAQDTKCPICRTHVEKVKIVNFA